MRRLFFALFVYLFYTFSFTACQSVSSSKTAKESVYVKDSLFSTVLHEMRYYEWYEPANAKQHPPAGLLLVLDGQALLDGTVHTVQSLAAEAGMSELNNWVVVGVGNIWLRDRDYTPSRELHIPRMDSMSAAQTGGVFPFLQFLQSELLPVINKRYPHLQRRVLLGHSFGGLAVLECFARMPELFTHYIAADPSLWWPSYEQKITPVLLNGPVLRPDMFLAVANVPEHNASYEQILTDKTATYTLQQPGVHILDKMQKWPVAHSWFSGRFFAGQDHQSIVQPACTAALRYFLEKKTKE